MTFESEYRFPAQLIINGQTIDVLVRTVSRKEDETPIIYDDKFRDSNGQLFIEPHVVGKSTQTITTFECVALDNKTMFKSNFTL